MSLSTSVTIEQERVYVDPQLLFQRLLTVARATENDLMEAFRHELCSIPPPISPLKAMGCFLVPISQCLQMLFGCMDERCFRPLLCTVKAELGRGQPGLMRWIWDETLADAIWILVHNEILVLQGNVQFVLDGVHYCKDYHGQGVPNVCTAYPEELWIG